MPSNERVQAIVATAELFEEFTATVAARIPDSRSRSTMLRHLEEAAHAATAAIAQTGIVDQVEVSAADAEPGTEAVQPRTVGTDELEQGLAAEDVATLVGADSKSRKAR